jgi:hypothetical protein
MSRPTDRQETFRPLQDKTLTNALLQVFVNEFGYQNKQLFAKAMIERILEVVDSFVKPTAMLRPGQLLWMAVANDGNKHLWKRMKDIPQVPVVLSLVTEDDLKALAKGDSYLSVRRNRHARLLREAYNQGGVLAQSDLAAISVMHHVRVAEDIAYFRENENCILPYRGSIQDVGGTFTHKVEVIRLYEAGYLEPDICRRLSIQHSLRAVENYVQTYKNVMKLIERGFAPWEVSGILGIGERLVKVYIDIIQEHHPKLTATSPCLKELDLDSRVPVA